MMGALSSVAWRARAGLVVAVAALGVSACGGSSESSTNSGASTGTTTSGGSAAPKDLKVAVMYIGADVEADEYSQAWSRGIKEAAEAYGADSVKVDNVTGVEYGEPGLATTKRLLARDYDLIIDTLDIVGLPELCGKTPSVKCLTYAVPKPSFPKNVTAIAFDFPQSYYLEGVAAGLLTESNVTGYVASIEVPFQKAYVNAFALGCLKTNPSCKTKVVYTNSFFDPPKAQQATQSLLNAGADVTTSFQDDPTSVRASAKKDAWAFGIYQSMEKFNPEKYVTTLQMQPMITDGVEKVLKITGEGGDFPDSGTYYGVANGLEPFGPWGANVPQDVQDRVAKELEALKEGGEVFAGPVVDTKGKVRIPEGEAITGGEVNEKINFYVKGVQR